MCLHIKCGLTEDTVWMGGRKNWSESCCFASSIYYIHPTKPSEMEHIYEYAIWFFKHVQTKHYSTLLPIFIYSFFASFFFFFFIFF